MQTSLSMYIHFPFCRQRCSYCDFATYAGLSRFIPAYINALCAEIRIVAGKSQEKLQAHTVFFGGGTPSLLSTGDVENILDACWRSFDFNPGDEITLEANPGTVTFDWLHSLRELGVNRISFGMQSADPVELRILKRKHEAADVIHAVEWSRKAGFHNLNLDLIFGIPGQDLASWEKSLDFALQLQPDHLSLYSLTVEDGTPLAGWVEKGLVQAPDEDLCADMYEHACQHLEDAGFVHYEISNWAKVDHHMDYRCQHNLQYWLMRPYLGFGSGAHVFAAGVRTANVRGVRAYLRRCAEPDHRSYPAGPALESFTLVDHWTEMQETMMVGLRLL